MCIRDSTTTRRERTEPTVPRNTTSPPSCPIRLNAASAVGRGGKYAAACGQPAARERGAYAKGRGGKHAAVY
eukprot:5927863-Pyramimonas_sp.AAC.1